CRAAAGAACRIWRPRRSGAGSARPDPARPVGGAGGGHRGPGEGLPQGLPAGTPAERAPPPPAARAPGAAGLPPAPARRPRPASLGVPARGYGYVLSRGIPRADPVTGLLPVIRHRCDEPSCQAAGHLAAGSAADNAHDYLARRQDPYSPLTDRRGPRGRAVAI